jgi:hypothetical protein
VLFVAPVEFVTTVRAVVAFVMATLAWDMLVLFVPLTDARV